jgi:hypothetical protein
MAHATACLGGSAFSEARPSRGLAQILSGTPSDMKQIHVWRHHIRIPHLDLVLYRSTPGDLGASLDSLARLGFDTRPGNVELHEQGPSP